MILLFKYHYLDISRRRYNKVRTQRVFALMSTYSVGNNDGLIKTTKTCFLPWLHQVLYEMNCLKIMKKRRILRRLNQTNTWIA